MSHDKCHAPSVTHRPEAADVDASGDDCRPHASQLITALRCCQLAQLTTDQSRARATRLEDELYGRAHVIDEDSADAVALVE